ncbi:hypothetical protein B0H16DRAFT_1465503 [Mycena metata]|uniref:Uncharacterized protein n=1 Tax=Mycena metata TaxID=1033252 RepID=A0AAD7MZ78_9AGAR|nr:hypothetical protein B0H16DRAFT_1465503 [Mycena metata]
MPSNHAKLWMTQAGCANAKLSFKSMRCPSATNFDVPRPCIYKSTLAAGVADVRCARSTVMPVNYGAASASASGGGGAGGKRNNATTKAAKAKIQAQRTVTSLPAQLLPRQYSACPSNRVNATYVGVPNLWV